MRVHRVLGLLFAFALLTVVAQAAGRAEELGFRTDKDAVMAEAQAGGQRVFAFFTTDWCSWCRRLENDVFATEEWMSGTEQWLKLVIDAEKGTGVDWARRYHVSGFPTLILLEADGSEIDRVAGYMPMPAFLETFQDFAKGIGTLDALSEQLAANPVDFELKLQVARKLEERGRVDETRAHLAEILEADPANASGVADDADAALAMGWFRINRDPAPLEEVLVRWPGLESGPEIYNILIALASRDGNDARMRTLLDRAIQDYPVNVELLNGYAWTFAVKGWDLDKARKAAMKAVELSGEDANVLDTLAEVQFRSGDKKAALATIERALKARPGDEYLQGQKQRYSEN